MGGHRLWICSCTKVIYAAYSVWKILGASVQYWQHPVMLCHYLFVRSQHVCCSLQAARCWPKSKHLCQPLATMEEHAAWFSQCVCRYPRAKAEITLLCVAGVHTCAHQEDCYAVRLCSVYHKRSLLHQVPHRLWHMFKFMYLHPGPADFAGAQVQ